MERVLGLQAFGRRDFLGSCFKTVVDKVFLSPLQEHKMVSARKVFDIFGLHAAPDIGGGLYADRTISDLKALKARTLVALHPSRELLERAVESNIRVISRAFLKNNSFDDRKLRAMVGFSKKYIDWPVIQPFNEVNLLTETGGLSMSPEKHVREHFMRAAHLVEEYNGITLLTPLAQKAPIDEFEYFSRMLKELRKHASYDWLDQYVEIGLHHYVFEPGENLWKRIEDISEIMKDELGFVLPMVITEAGLWQELNEPYDQEVFAQETLRQLKSEIPSNLPVVDYCYWTHSNQASRPVEHSRYTEVRQFELSVWRGVDGETEVFRVVAEYASRG